MKIMSHGFLLEAQDRTSHVGMHVALFSFTAAMVKFAPLVLAFVGSATAFAPASRVSLLHDLLAGGGHVAFSLLICSRNMRLSYRVPGYYHHSCASQTPASSTLLEASMSKSLPFLVEPKNLDGYVGNVGFDPLGFADWFDIKWLREAELKHCRASMLATVGFVVQEYVTLPGYTHVDDSNLGPTVVGASPMLQIILFLGCLEFWTNKGNVTMETMFSDPARVPGDLGFDPMGMAKGKSPADMEKLQLQELKNGRLAMLAIGGMIHHNWVTGDPLF
jgi:hypothetical protein